VLMYHQVGKFKEPKEHRSCYCDVDRFRNQMAFLKFADYQVISLEQAYAALFGTEAPPRRSVVLSFDDGYENFADSALPILEDFGYPSVLFAVSGLLGQPAKWLGMKGEKPLLLSSSRLRDLRKAKVEIGSHTKSHPRLGRLPTGQAWREIADSKSELENVLGEPVKFFAYPYGDYSPNVRDAVVQAGYQAALTCSRGSANSAPNAFEIPRKAISYGDNLLGFFWKLAVKNQRKDRYE
jgi:peptidoglycan/xylan/chitin deacetylase (PgdA/CDA1 family)